MAVRIDDEDGVVLGITENDSPFGLGKTMKVVGVEMEDDLCGIIFKVKAGRRTASVPLLDLEVTDDNDMNKQYLEEYVAWFSERMGV